MKSRSLLVATVLALTALSGCGTTGSGAGGGERTVAAAFYPLAWTAEQVAGDRYDVVNLTSPGSEPHDLELSVRQVAALREADLVIHQKDFQPAVDDAVGRLDDDVVLDAAEVVDLVAHPGGEEEHEGHDHAEGDGDDGHDHGHDDGHDHGDLDPHFWQDPLRMADLGDAVAERLADLDPTNAEVYERNAADLHAELEELDQEYRDGLASCDRDVVVVNHDAFGYLAKYGLDLHPVLGLSPEAEPTAATLARLADLVRDAGVTTVFTERLASPKAAERLAATTGVETAVLDTVEGLGDDTAGEDYLSLMRANLTALQEANGC